MSDSRYRKVPSGRLSRLSSFGQLAGGIAGGMLAEGARRLASGQRPQMSDLLLTPANAVRVTEQLSRLRGAAMKLGQMISLDAGDLLPAELTQILARLRDAAHFMPPAQLDKVLTGEWGSGWRRRFTRFDATPIAAASIGQVHKAVLPDGRVVAVKVQYPGVADSIDADVDNVATLLKLSGLLPESLDVAPLLAEAKRQLHEEADYLREAEQLRRYRDMLVGEPQFLVPEAVDELSGVRVLVMDFVEGKSIEALAVEPQDRRDQALGALFALVLRELFEFGYMQTDPNFANFRWQPESGRIVLLDFGAAREVPPELSEAYASLLSAGLAEDREALLAALLDVGFISPAMQVRHQPALDHMIEVLMAKLGKPGEFDFADRAFVTDLRADMETIGRDRQSWHVPPAQTLFVQRKISGTALLAVRLQARLPLRQMVADTLTQRQARHAHA